MTRGRGRPDLLPNLSIIRDGLRSDLRLQASGVEQVEPFVSLCFLIFSQSTSDQVDSRGLP